MSTDEGYIDQVTKAWETSLEIPSLVKAKINPDGTTCTSTWSQTSVAAGEKVSYNLVHFNVQDPDNSTATPPQVIKSGDITATGGGLTVKIYKNDSKDDVLYIYQANGTSLIKSVNLTDLDLHGEVYYDSELGGVTISPDGSKIAFIAERKAETSDPFFRKLGPSKKATKIVKEPKVKGQEYKYEEDFGEQLVGKKHTVIAIYDVQAGTLEVISFEDLKAVGEISFLGNGTLIGTCYDLSPFPLGVIYCTNRPSRVFKMDIVNSAGTLEFVSAGADGLINCKTPRVSPDGNFVVWMERDLKQGGNYPGPHRACQRLMVAENLGSPRILIDTVDTEDANGFCGLYDFLPQDCWINNETVVFSNVIYHTMYPIIANARTSTYSILKSNPCVDILNCDPASGFILAKKSDPVSPQNLIIGSYVDETAIAFKPLTQPMELKDGPYEYQTFEFSGLDGIKFNAIYQGPVRESPNSVPVILFPHGGPHGVMLTSFSAANYYFGLLGYGVISVNYRGSTGAGQNSIISLLGNIGRNDVDDCMTAFNGVTSAITSLNPANAYVMGGSHGGFLTLHLSGQNPDQFRAFAARNPASCLNQFYATDIPDWAMNEGGFDYKFKSPDSQQVSAMVEKSPVFYVDNVVNPVMLFLGKKDLRVPYYNGLEFYHSMKANGRECQIHMYPEDNHPLDKVPTQANVYVNMALFFKDSSV